MIFLERLIGAEQPLRVVADSLRRFADSLNPAVVGAHQLCCSDEAEKENVATFHKQVVRPLLPDLKFWSRSSFRTVNLGGRYEPGSLSIAEEHYATPESQEEGAFKVMLVKVSAHVSRSEDDLGTVWGCMNRYERESVYCGAMHALLEGGGAGLPFRRELVERFREGGIDRLAVLRDPRRTPPRERELRAAVVNARLQARAAVAEARAMKVHSPTVFLVFASVTLNNMRPDSELPVGFQVHDTRATNQRGWVGLEGDPRRYQVGWEGTRLRVSEEERAPVAME